MTKASITLLLLLGMICVHAQSPVLQWAKGLGGASEDAGTALAVDAAGNAISVGYFHGTTDLDPGAGSFMQTSNGYADIFISKLDASGNFVWAKTIGGTDFDNGLSVATDAGGNIYVTGYFKGTVDFDPGPGMYDLSATGRADFFILKLDASGNLQWARSMGGTGDDYSYTIGIDPSGNVFIAGYFQNLVDFDAGPGFSFLSAVNTFDIFLCKYDVNGNFNWVKQFGPAQAFSNSIFYNQCSVAFDGSGNIYLAGDFIGTGDFDPGAGTVSLSSAGGSDIFIAKLNASGNLQWAKRMGGPSDDYCFCIAVDASGNICTSGNFAGTADFDPDGGFFPLTSSGGSSDIFISKLTNSGSFTWAKKIGGAGADWGNAICFDVMGNVYTSGYFYGSVDFDPGPGTAMINPGNNLDVYVNKLDPNGNHLFAINMGGSGGDLSTGLYIDANMDIYVEGQFNLTADFDPGPAQYNLTSAGVSDVFVVKLYQYCIPVVTITANPSTAICPGTPVTFTATPVNGGPNPTYQWQVNGSNAGSNSASFTTSSLVNGDVVTVIMTSNAPCALPTTATSNAITIVVNTTLPPAVTISPSPAGPVCAGTAVTFTATPVNGGATPTYQWKLNGVNVGTNSPTFTSSSFVNGDDVSVTMTSSLSCAVPASVSSSSFIMSVNPLLTPTVNITAFPSGPVCAGSTINFTATITNGGNNPVYQWKVNGVNVGTNSPGYSSATLANGDIVSVTLISNATCATPATVSAATTPLVVNPLLTPAVSVVQSPSGPVCAGSLFTFTATAVNGGINPSYQWKVNGVNAGTNSPVFSSGSLSNNDVITVVMTSSEACVTTTTATSVPVTVIVNPLLPPSVTVSVSPAGPICAGTPVTFTATPVNGGTTPSYQWKINGLNAGTNSPVFTSSTLLNNDVVTVTLTSSETCASPLTANSAAITMAVNPLLTPAVLVSASPAGSICPGTPVSFTATITNGGNAPVYQWKLNGTNVGTNSPSYSSATLVNGDIISVTVISNETCASPSSVTNSVTMVITPQVAPTVSITASPAGAVCPGSPVTFTANPSGGGNNPSYQWKLNGINTGTNSAVYTSSTLVTGDVITVVMTSDSPCAVPSTATSPPFNIVVNPPLTPSVVISQSPAGAVCAGTTVTFTASPANGGTSPSYQWKLNGVNVGNNSPVYSSALLNNNDVVSVVMTSNATCATPQSVSSSLSMVINPLLTPSVVITSSPAGSVCDGTTITFSATSTNGGSTPSYQWKVNGINVGSNSPTFSSGALNNGDQVTVQLISSEACATPSTAVSNIITASITSNLTPSVAITASPSGAVCAGVPVTFTANGLNGGTSPSYQWKVNGVNAGTNSPVFTSSSLANGDQVMVVLTSNAVCAVPTSASSNNIQVTVNPVLQPAVSISSSPAGAVCPGTVVNFTASVTHGGPSPSYQWKVNGVNVGTNSSAFSSSSLNNNDIITVEMTSNANCVSPVTVTSNTITQSVNPPLVPAITISASPSGAVCPGTMVNFSAAIVNGGNNPVYQWKVNGINAGTNSPSFSSSTLLNGDIVTVGLISNATCASPVSIVSQPLTMQVNSVVVPSVNISSQPTGAICAGATVTFSAISSGGGNSPVYQWKLNGVNVGSNSSTFTWSSFADQDVVTLEMTSSSSCAVPSVVTSNTVTMDVMPVVVPSVTISAVPATAICPGTTVLFTASAQYPGQAPVYQWKVNGINAGTNSTTFSTSTLMNGDIVSVELTSNANCAAPVSVSSNNFIAAVNPLLVPAVTIVASPAAAVCPGTPVNFTATGINGGNNPVYQWKVNGINAGINSPNFSSAALVDGDVVTVEMTSNAICPSVATVNSNAITADIMTPPVPSVNIVASPAGPVCPGTLINYTATPANGGNAPSYQWKINGMNAGTNSPVFSSSSLTNGDIISVEMVSTMACAAPALVNSNSIIQVVNPTPVPAVSINSNINGAICPGTSMTFSALPVNGGTSPDYQWKINGVNTGTNSPVFSSSAFVNGDVVSLVMTSNASCVSPATANSNIIPVTVNPTVVPAVTISSSTTGPVCSGSTIQFTATPVNGGVSPSYKWELNGSHVGMNSPAFTMNKVRDGDVVKLSMTSNALCAVPATVISNAIDLKIDYPACPSYFYMPTGFTPNHDGRNDILKPSIEGKLVNYKFSIFNRWGQKIFESMDIMKGWDGKVYGTQTDSNVFVWYCTFQFIGQPAETRKGTVVLIR